MNSWKSKYGLLLLCFTLPLTIQDCAQHAGATAPDEPRSPNAVPGAPGIHNGRLVFTSDRHNTALSIWTVNPDGSSPRRLTDTRPRGPNLPIFVHIYDDSPVWSPDGTRVAFHSNRDYSIGSADSSRSIYIMNADGSNVTRILVDGIEDYPEIGGMAWSPDGTKFAFDAGTHGTIPEVRPTINIYTVDITGANLTKLTHNTEVANVSPTWSPDGSQIAFVSNRDPDTRQKIWVMNADGSNERRLTDIHNTSSPQFYGDQMPDWSPDGTRILFNGYRDFNGTRNCFVANCFEIFVMNADGSNDKPLTNDTSRGDLPFFPRWSPDGTKIVFSVGLSTIQDIDDNIDRGRAIIVMNADGTNQVDISNRLDYAFFDVSVDWQPLLQSSTEPPPSVVGFSSSAYGAYEDVGSIPVTVTRTGNLNDAASCFYITEDGTATYTYNYNPAFGMLSFAPGEASKTFPISLTDNHHPQGNVSFKVSLFDNEGNATFLGGNREATITVLDKDTVPRAGNPIDQARAFVRQHYVDFLNREPDQAGLDFWTDQITSCGMDAHCLDIKRQHVSAAFFLSIEFQETGFFVQRVYELGAHATWFLRDTQRIGSGVVVGQPGWQERLEANKAEWVQQLFDEDKVRISFGFTNQRYVELLFQYGKLTPAPGEIEALVAELNAGTETRPGLFRRIVDDGRLKNRLFRPSFVFMEYVGYLRRGPDDGGFNFWLNKLNQFNGDYVAAEMVKAFIISTEYRSRFGQP